MLGKMKMPRSIHVRVYHPRFIYAANITITWKKGEETRKELERE